MVQTWVPIEYQRGFEFYENMGFKLLKTAENSAIDSLTSPDQRVTPATSHKVARKVQIEYLLANEFTTEEKIEAHFEHLKELGFANKVIKIY